MTVKIRLGITLFAEDPNSTALFDGRQIDRYKQVGTHLTDPIDLDKVLLKWFDDKLRYDMDRKLTELIKIGW